MSCLRDGKVNSKLKVVLLLVVLLSIGGVTAGPSIAASASPHWSILSESEPTYFKAGDTADAYVLIIRDDGGAPTTAGKAMTVTDTLPAGVTATKVAAKGEGANSSGSPKYELACTHVPVTGTVSCTYEEGLGHGRVLAGAVIVMTITVSIPEGITTLGPNSATVSGGGAPSASVIDVAPIDDATVPFGLSIFNMSTVTEAGEPDAQAGSHPFDLVTSLGFNVSGRESPSLRNGGVESPLANTSPKDIEVALPPGSTLR